MTERDVSAFEALMEILVDEGHMTPLAVMQIKKLFTGTPPNDSSPGPHSITPRPSDVEPPEIDS